MQDQLLIYSTVSTIQGTSSFPFQNLVNVEFGLIEEPNMTLETLQTFKKLAEGVDTEVAVKFKPDQTVQRTPLLITSNDHFDKNAPYSEKRAFDTRYSEFTFLNEADFLIHFKKMINPGIWNDLFYKHCFNDLIRDEDISSDDSFSTITEEYNRLVEANGRSGLGDATPDNDKEFKRKLDAKNQRAKKELNLNSMRTELAKDYDVEGITRTTIMGSGADTDQFRSLDGQPPLTRRG